jgi:hypothetical protein
MCNASKALGLIPNTIKKKKATHSARSQDTKQIIPLWQEQG